MFFRTVRIGCILLSMGAAMQAQDRAPDNPPADAPVQTPVSPPPEAGTEGALAHPQPSLPPLVRFSRSNSGWSANVSFADPVVEIQWSVSKDGPFRSTGSLPNYDQRTRRPMANSGIQVPAGTTAIHVRYLDRQDNWVGPFEFAFDPAAETVRFYRSILETTTGSWLAFRRSAPNILYYTHIAGYRCAIREFRVGLDTDVPDRVVKLAPCDMRDPSGNPTNADTHLWIDPKVNFASAQVVYADGTVSKVMVFQR